MSTICETCNNDGIFDLCPICLADMPDDAATLRMPVCGHLIHTTCALSAAQYDVRCPVCRTRDPSIETKTDRETRIFSQLEEYATRQDELVRTYKRRRAQVIRRHDSLKRLRDRARDEKRSFALIDIELDREWVRLQRDAWINNETIKDIKNRRRRQQRRLSDINRRLNQRLYPLLGTPPESIELL